MNDRTEVEEVWGKIEREANSDLFGDGVDQPDIDVLFLSDAWSRNNISNKTTDNTRDNINYFYCLSLLSVEELQPCHILIYH